MPDTVVGIDLGTSNSVVTAVLEGEPIVIPDDQDERIHPSVVHYEEDGGTIVGNEAVEYRIQDPEHTVYSVKRLVGRPFDHPDVKVMIGAYPYPIVESSEGTPRIEMYGEHYTPEEISAEILDDLVDRAERYLAEEIDEAVITVPANFDEGQRRATQRAAEGADLEVMRLLNEPTAAALAYGYGDAKHERIAIYDFGGGTFDISILELRDNIFEVVSTAGNSYLGGDDMDYRLVSMMLNAFERQHGYDLSGDETVQQRLKAVAQRIKHELTERESVKAKISEYVPGTVTKLDLEFTLTRETFSRRCSDIVEETLETCEEALSEANLQRAAIDHLVMVGGSTRVPVVQQKVRSFFSQDPVLEINPDEVVSIGAAILGSTLAEDRTAPPISASDGPEPDAGSSEEPAGSSAPGAESRGAGAEPGGGPESDRPLLIDVTPHALGVATVGGVMDIIIERNGSLPLERSRTFSTSRDDQTRVVLPIYAGNSRRIEENRELGALELEDLPPRPREEVEIEVTFRVDTDGMVSVRAVDSKTGNEQSAELSILGDTAEELEGFDDEQDLGARCT